MTMDRRKLETGVGLFVIVSVLIFFYLTFQIGAFRFDRGQYESYTVLFTDTHGLTKKDEIKVAGVKIGRIEDICLTADHTYRARAVIKISTQCELHRDACCCVRHDGLLGRKYLDIVPGTPALPLLEPHSQLICTGEGAGSFDGMMKKAGAVTARVDELVASVNQAINPEKRQSH